MKPSFEKTVDILVKAYLNDTLQHGNCYACAVGNLVADGLGTCVVVNATLLWANGEPYPGSGSFSDPGWGAVFATSINRQNNKKKQEIDKRYLASARVQRHIEATGYTWEELARIEWAFESVDHRRKDKMFRGLMAVVDVLAEIHGIDLETKESAKLLFVKA